MSTTHEELASKWLGQPYEALDARAQKVARHVAARRHIARNVVAEADEKPTRGQRAADAVARFGGSWAFVGLFGATMLGWVSLNGWLLVHDKVDSLRDTQWRELLQIQQRQLDLLATLIARERAASGPAPIAR